jgi:hypothetical protein
MSEPTLNFKPEIQDSNALIFSLLMLAVVLVIWLIVKKKYHGVMLGESVNSHGENVNVISQKHLPRGGLLVQVEIGDRLIYLVETNKCYIQIDPSISLESVPLESVRNV